MPLELRPYQEDALQAIRSSVGQGVKRLVCQAPTGSGKTLVAATIVQGALSKGNKLAFVVSSLSLIDQAVEMFWNEGIKDVGVIQQDHILTDWSKPVQVCSIDTIRSRKAYPQAQIVVYDECHRLTKAHIRWMQDPDWQSVPFLGLSATPWTKGLGKHFESLLIMSTTKELIELGYLSPFRVMAADHPDLTGVKTRLGDYAEEQLSQIMQDQGLVANIVQTWKMQWNKDKTLLFAVDCAHAQQLQARFNEAGIPCGYQDAFTTDKERKEIKRKFHNGEYKVVANISTLTTGVDWDVRCLVLARPTKSEMLFVQIIGRALRTAPGKEHALILDHSDSHARLGFVTDIHHDYLDDGKPKKNTNAQPLPPLPKPCPQCDYLIPPRVMVCPYCGFQKKIESKLFEREGQLVEINPNGRPVKRRDPQEYPYSYEEKRMFYAQLKAYALDRGWKPGWAKVNYREKFREWPAWTWDQLPPAEGVGTEVRTYVRMKFEAWAIDPKNPRRRMG